MVFRKLISVLFFVFLSHITISQEVDYEEFDKTIEEVTRLTKAFQFDQANQLTERLEKELEGKLKRPNEYFGSIIYLKAKILHDQDKFKEAIPILKDALSEYRPIETEQSYLKQGDINNLIGMSFGQISQLDSSIYYLNLAKILFTEKAKSEEKLSILLSNLGQTYIMQGNFRKAEEILFQSLQLKLKLFGNQDNNLQHSYSAIAQLYSRMGRYNRALEYQQQAFEISERFEKDDLFTTYKRHSGLAKALIETRKDSLAIYHLNMAQNALNSLPEFIPMRQANIDERLGYLYTSRREHGKAIQYYLSMVKHYTSALGENDVRVAVGYHNLADNYLYLYDFENTEKYEKKAIAIFEKLYGDQHPNLVQAYLLLADNFRFSKEYDKAIEFAELGIKANVGFSDDTMEGFLNVEDKNLLVTSFMVASRVYSERSEGDTVDLNDIKKSLLYYSYCDYVMKDFQENGTLKDNMRILDILDIVYDNSLEYSFLLYSDKKDSTFLEEGFFFAERSKNVLLKQQLKRSNQKKYLNIPADLLELEQALKEDISQIKSKLYELSSEDDTIDSIELADNKDLLFEKQQALDNLKSTFQKDYPSYYKFKYKADHIPANDLRSYLSPDTQVIQFVSSHVAFYVFSITQDSTSFIKTRKGKDFEKNLKNYLTMLGNPSSDLNELTGLGKKLFAKTLAPLGELKRNLIIIPDSELNSLPFETLVPTDSLNNSNELPYLIKNHTINYLTSAFEITRVSNKKKPRSIDLMALASNYSSNQVNKDPDTTRANLGPLEWAVKEAEGLVNSYGGISYLNESATEKIFRENVKGKKVIHIASHGVVDHKRPLFSRLVLEKDPSDSIYDGNLFVHELYNLSLDADMVVLSACNTARGQVINGEGLLNIGKGFLYTGAPSVVMSHWQVDDKSTSELMQYFYEALANGNKKSEALKEAKIRFISEASPNKKHPFYWGAFITMGDDSPIVQTGVAPIMILIPISLILILVGVFVRKRRQAAI